jgi:signal transduction histidine kinase
MICGRNSDDTITYANAAYCRFFGAQPHDLVGTRWMPPVVRPDKSVLDSFSSPSSESMTCLRLVENERKQIVPLFVEYIGLFNAVGLSGYCSIARKPIQEPNRLGSTHQNERFNDFRIARKEQTIRALALSVAEAQEKERRKIAVDLHDDIGQMLYLLRMKIDGLRELGNAPGILDESISILDQIIAKTRSMTADIGSRILQDFGLSQAIRAFAEEIERQFSITFQVSIDALPDDIPETIQAISYRVIRELLFNIVKHAEADLATVHVQSGAGFIKVDIADNGAPRDAVVDVDRFGFGLKSIREQIQLVGGVFLIKINRALGGIHVQFVLPTSASDSNPGK